MEHLLFPIKLLENIDIVYTFLLITVRFIGMLLFLPGIGMGEKGLKVRIWAIMVMSYASVLHGPYAELPENWALLLGAVLSEILFGTILGLVPHLMIASLHYGAQIATTSMGLGAAQLMDPTMGIQVPSLGRIFADLVICAFLFMNGHHVIIYAVSGMGSEIIPGTYVIGTSSLQMLMHQTSAIFSMGFMISAPILVALLLTQFVMGLVSKAVPQVNIFVVSFPLTIGIGLTLAMLAMPEILNYSTQQLGKIEQIAMGPIEDVQRVESVP